MDKLSLSNLIEGYFGNSLQPLVKNSLTDYLWSKVKIAIDEAEDKGYDRGYDLGYLSARDYYT